MTVPPGPPGAVGSSAPGGPPAPGGPGGPAINPYGAVDLAALAQAREAQQKADAARARAASGDGNDAQGSVTTVIDVSEATFEVDVLQRSLRVPVVIDFWAEWCGPCKQLSPILERLAIEDGGSWVLAKVDVDANQQLSAAAQVQSIPTVMVVWQGQVIPGFQGALPEAQVRDFLNQVIALPEQIPGQAGESQAGESPSGDPQAPHQPTAETATDDPELAAADDALARDDLDAAEAGYRQILATRPDHVEARQALGSVTLLKRTAGLDAAAVIAAANGSDEVTANTQAADLELMSGEVDAAFTRLVELVRRTSGDEREAVKEHLLELLDLVGNDVPEVLVARRALANALF
jgi:putative thioredoxin